LTDLVFTLAVLIPAAILAITFHEAAHAIAADRLGDPTARERGRASLNPLRHIDPFGTVLLPLMLFVVPQLLGGQGFLFGWAKPVPVQVWRLGKPRRDMALVAAAGPAINAVLALLAAVGFWIVVLTSLQPSGQVDSALFQPLRFFVQMNLALVVFNLMPLLPLDGGRILTALLPRSLARQFQRTEPYGLPVILLAFVFAPWILGQADVEFRPGQWLVEGPLQVLFVWVLELAWEPVRLVEWLRTGRG